MKFLPETILIGGLAFAAMYSAFGRAHEPSEAGTTRQAGEVSLAQVEPGAIYQGVALWEGPPADCPHGETACDHGVRLEVACDGKTMRAEYRYPELETTCRATARFAYGLARPGVTSWLEEDAGCTAGKVSLAGTDFVEVLDFRWERASNGEEVTVGSVSRVGSLECS